jgi:hypothetical protein
VTATGYVPSLGLAGARADAVAFLHCVDAQCLFAEPNVNGLFVACHDTLAKHDPGMVTPVGVDVTPAPATHPARRDHLLHGE